MWEGGAGEGSKVSCPSSPSKRRFSECLFVHKQTNGYVCGGSIKEGLRAFVEKRKPSWVDSKL